jgi:hypothetical protein
MKAIGRRVITAGFALLVALAASGAGACNTLQNSAAKDPMKCERDPKCQQKDKAHDCSAQCSDDPACVDRCNEIQQVTGASQR